jgi:hypothetical protein
MNCSFGLSDLHGDGRVHDISGPETPSGFGFELTFRLKREPGETAPPTWPAAVMQALAKYVFQSGMLTPVRLLFLYKYTVLVTNKFCEFNLFCVSLDMDITKMVVNSIFLK